jgi:hypothetical protein
MGMGSRNLPWGKPRLGKIRQVGQVPQPQHHLFLNRWIMGYLFRWQLVEIAVSHRGISLRMSSQSMMGDRILRHTVQKVSYPNG